MISFKRTTFVKSVVALNERPPFSLPEVIFIGRSNVGKSSLINALCGNKSLSKVSSMPGKTRYLNYFNVDDGFYLVDAPGFGYSAYGKGDIIDFGALMESYFTENASLKLALYLLDSRREIATEDQAFFKQLKRWNIPFIIVFTKGDTLNQSARASLEKKRAMLLSAGLQSLVISIEDKASIEKVQSTVLHAVQR